MKIGFAHLSSRSLCSRTRRSLIIPSANPNESQKQISLNHEMNGTGPSKPGTETSSSPPPVVSTSVALQGVATTYLIAQLSPAVLETNASLAEQAAVSVGAASLQALISIYLYFLKAKQPSPLAAEGAKKQILGAGLGGAVAALGTQVLITAALLSLSGGSAITDSASGSAADRAMLADQSAALPALLAAAALAPISEELVFRGLVLPAALEQTGSAPAALALSSLVFAAWHGNPAEFPQLFALGLVFGGSYLVGGRNVGAAFLAHALYNLVVAGSSVAAAAAGN